MCWALEHLSGLMNLGCGLWGGYVYEECTTTLSCFHVLLSHSPYLPKDFCSAYSRLNFNLEQHGKRGWIQNNSRFTDKELWFLPPKLVSKEVPCCKWHYKERQGYIAFTSPRPEGPGLFTCMHLRAPHSQFGSALVVSPMVCHWILLICLWYALLGILLSTISLCHSFDPPSNFRLIYDSVNDSVQILQVQDWHTDNLTIHDNTLQYCSVINE